ncbi:hypothetical protein AB0M97_25365 [Streptomyces sp. NPDC051207]|uniref:hypothetical protein n=1 Tax=Streptomyces sp. NPDC051207 TaxID=3154641 RepID=UPI003412FC2A
MKAAQSVPMPMTTGAEACTAYDGFFHDDYTTGTPEVRAATALCRRCPLPANQMIRTGVLDR